MGTPEAVGQQPPLGQVAQEDRHADRGEVEELNAGSLSERGRVDRHGGREHREHHDARCGEGEAGDHERRRHVHEGDRDDGDRERGHAHEAEDQGVRQSDETEGDGDGVHQHDALRLAGFEASGADVDEAAQQRAHGARGLLGGRAVCARGGLRSPGAPT
jgi:hypothetical protein